MVCWTPFATRSLCCLRPCRIAQGTTLEAWVKFTDLNVRWSTLLQYVTLSPTAGNGEATVRDNVHPFPSKCWSGQS